jgi:putative flippase GtrA
MQIFREPGRYLVVGAACAACNNVILIVGDHIGLHYGVLIILTFLLVIPAGYLAHSLWTFHAQPSWPSFRNFIFGSVAGTFVAALVIFGLKTCLPLPMIVIAPTATVIMMIYNYIMARCTIALRQSRT